MDPQPNQLTILCETIARLRKENKMTQEELASQLMITFQAVSKWETGASSPDISLLPQIADIFSVSLDELFGRTSKAPCQSGLQWPDDDTLRAVAFKGHTLLSANRIDSSARDAMQRVEISITGPALNVESAFSVHCEDGVDGDIKADGDVNCGGAVNGHVKADGDVNCASIQGHANAGGDLSCASIGGNANAGGDLNCVNIEGNANAGGDLRCEGDIGAGAAAGRNLHCGGDIASGANAGSVIECEGDIAGNVSAGGNLHCGGDIQGSVKCQGGVTCQSHG